MLRRDTCFCQVLHNARVFGFLKRETKAQQREPARDWVALKGGLEFPLAQHLARHQGYPIVDWPKVRAWVDGIEPERRRGEAWTACEISTARATTSRHSAPPITRHT